MLLLIAGCATGSRTEPLAFTDSTVGTANQGRAQTIYLPATSGLHPAIMILSKCWASADTYESDWGVRLASWGYVALVVDSLRPRGVTTRCNNHGDTSARANLPDASLAGDLLAGAAYLRSRPDVDANRLGVLGIDLGAAIVVNAAQVAVLEKYRARPFRTLIASSPGNCGLGEGAKLASDLLILAGDRDDFDPDAAGCREFGAAVDRNGHVLVIKIYSGAYHLFDTPIPLHLSGDGHMIGSNRAAMADSRIQVRDFLAASMGH